MISGIRAERAAVWDGDYYLYQDYALGFMGWGLLFVSGLCLGFYLLYINGLFMLSAKIAVIFVGYIRKNGEAALQFAGCNGQVKRVLRFHKAGNYEFVYRSEISEGAVTLQILDEKRRELTMRPNWKWKRKRGIIWSSGSTMRRENAALCGTETEDTI